MPRKTSAWNQWLQYLAVQCFSASVTCWGAPANLAMAAAAGRAFYRFGHTHRRRARAHLQASFPSWEPARVEAVAESSFVHFAQLLAEVYFMPRLVHPHNCWAKTVYDPDDDGLRWLTTREPALLITGHLGNWEALGFFLAVGGQPLRAVARPLDNPFLNRWLLRMRERRGLGIIEKWSDPVGQIVEALDRQEAVGFIADQNAGDGGVFVPFFGRLASTHKTIGLLAVRLQLPVICGFARRVNAALDYHIATADIIRPADWADHPAPQYYVTARYMRAIESMVRSHPTQYLWMHRRWKSRPRHEREGRAMPDALRRNLESLPWMDDAGLRQLEAPVPVT